MKTKTINFRDKQILTEVRDSSDHIQKHWDKGVFYECQRNGLLSYIRNTISDGGKYFDIGASIGNHTLFFSMVMNADVFSFEPDLNSYDHLCSNIVLNGLNDRVVPLNIALGSKVGKCGMKSVSDDNVGMRQVDEGKGDTPILPIDELSIFEGYDLIKIDVEHYNEELLKGAENTFTNGKGVIFIEAESEEELNMVDEYMYSYGYQRQKPLVLNHTPTYKYFK